MQWFRETPWCYVPRSGIGWFLTLLTASLCAQVLFVFERSTFTTGEFLSGAVPYLLFFLGALVLIARVTSTDVDDTR